MCQFSIEGTARHSVRAVPPSMANFSFRTNFKSPDLEKLLAAEHKFAMTQTSGLSAGEVKQSQAHTTP